MKAKNIFGVALMLGGVVLGAYVGIWVSFIGGIIQIIEALQADVLIASQIAYGIGRILFAGVSGTLSAICLIVPGYGLLE